jgi:hypothetical protein
MKQRMRYALIRFVPDPTRGEAINLGLLAGTDDRAWFKVAFTPSFPRIRALAGSAGEAYAKALIRDLDEGLPQDGRQMRLFGPTGQSLADLLFGDQPSPGHGMVQVGLPQPALTDNPEETFGHLLRQLVGGQRRPRRLAVSVPQSRDGLKRIFRARAIDDWNLPLASLVEGDVVGGVRHPVDFGLLNGRLRAVVHTVSFAAELHSALWQRAVLAEAAWDLQGAGVRFAMLYARAPNADNEAKEMENNSVAFVTAHDIRAVPSDRLDEMEDLVREVAARH